MKEAVSIATNDFYLQAKTSIIDNMMIKTDEKNVTVSLTIPIKDIGKVVYDDNTLSSNDGDVMNPSTIKKLVGEFAESLTAAKDFKENNPNVYVMTSAEYERLSRKYSSD